MPIPGVTVEDVDAYSDVSNGSTISVGSAASGGSAHMPRPPTGGSRRPKSAQGRRSRVAKSPYSSSQLKSSTKQQPPKPAARNMWITAMRNGTSTLSSEYSPMKTLSGSRAASVSKQNRSGTRTRHLSDYVQVDNLKNKNHVRSASMSASEPHLSGGGPAYKPQEDYYDEIIELKKVINALKAENNAINTKLHRVEGENVLKDRKMEDLLNTRKQPEDVRRTLTDKKGDTSAIVNSLKQKLHAVERTVKDKEAELSQLKNDMKMSNIEELQIQSETYYQEVQRLQLALIEMQQSRVHDSFGRTSPRDNTIPKGMKGKPASVSLQRLAEENDHLKAENRSLKKDLLTAIENASGNKNVPLKAHYADMNRGQLLAKIHELEEKVQESGGKGSLTRKGSIPEDKESDVEVRRKSVSKLNSQVPGRIELRGTTSQKLAQLQEREIELLEEREKQREIIERLKEDRAHYRSVADDLRLQLKSTQEELDRVRDEKGVVGERRRSSTSLTSPTRKLSVKEVPPRDDQDEDLDRMLNDFQQQRAAKALQRQWRGYQGRKKQHMEEEEERQTQDRQNQAASTLQKNWRRHRDRTKQKEEEDKEQAVSEIQAALRGHAVRNKYIEQLDKELEYTDRDDAVVAIQSAMRAHAARQKHLGSPEEELQSRDTRTRGSSSRSLHDSEPDSDEGLVTKASVSKRHPEPARPGLRRSSFTGPQDSSGHEAWPPSANHKATAALARDSSSNQQEPTRDKAHELARNEAPAPRDTAHVNALSPTELLRGRARDQALVTSAPARDPSQSDSDDDAVVVGRKNSRTEKQKNEKSTPLNTDESEERSPRTTGASKKDPQRHTKKSHGKKKADKEKAKSKDVDEEQSNLEEGTRRSLITAPRFSNISEERSEEEEAQVTSPSRPRSLQKRSGGLLESVPKETEQRSKKKPFEIVDSDDDDDDDAMVSRPRRSLDTGMSQQRPSLSRSSRGLSPPSTSSPREESRVSTVEGGRPGLSRSTGRVLGDSESSRDENLQRPGLSRSKRPLSGQRPGLNRSGSGADKETDSRASSLRKSSLPAGSEEDSEDDVIVTGKKTTTVSDKKTAGRPSLTRRSPAKTVPASSQRDSITNSLDNFFSSTVPPKESSSKKSPRKTAATFNDSDDDDDDDDDDEDEIVSSLSRFKSKQKGKASTDSKTSTDSVAGLWATSDKGSDSKNRRKSSTKWSPDFEFERPPSRSRPDSALDELF